MFPWPRIQAQASSASFTTLGADRRVRISSGKSGRETLPFLTRAGMVRCFSQGALSLQNDDQWEKRDLCDFHVFPCKSGIVNAEICLADLLNRGRSSPSSRTCFLLLTRIRHVHYPPQVCSSPALCPKAGAAAKWSRYSVTGDYGATTMFCERHGLRTGWDKTEMASEPFSVAT